MTSTVQDHAEVRDLAPGEVLAAVVERRRTADRAEADLLALAVHWVDLHPVTEVSPSVTVSVAQGVGAIFEILFRRPSARRLRHPGRERVRDRDPRPGPGALPRRGPAAGVRGGRAVLPTSTPLGAGPGRSVPGVESPPGRPADHPAVGRGDRVRGPAPRRHRLPEPDADPREAQGAGARGDAPARPGPGRRPRAGRPRCARGLVRPPRLDCHHRRDRTVGHPGRPRPGGFGR